MSARTVENPQAYVEVLQASRIRNAPTYSIDVYVIMIALISSGGKAAPVRLI